VPAYNEVAMIWQTDYIGLEPEQIGHVEEDLFHLTSDSDSEIEDFEDSD